MDRANLSGMRFSDAEKTQIELGAQMTFAQRLARLDEMLEQVQMLAGQRIAEKPDNRHLYQALKR